MRCNSYGVASRSPTTPRSITSPWLSVWKLFLRVCKALGAIHQQAVIHRDLKPTNILVDHTGRPYVIDFGLAQICDPALRPRGWLSGTPAYMSPEQIAGDSPIDAIM